MRLGEEDDTAGQPWVWTSALTVLDGPRRTVVHSDSHPQGRQASYLTHELAHALFLRDPRHALDDGGCHLWDQSIENEAHWLAGALLLAEDAAAEEYFGIGEQIVSYRFNVSGARMRVARARGFRIAQVRLTLK